MSKKYIGIEDFINQFKKKYEGKDKENVSFVILENEFPEHMSAETTAKYIDNTKNGVYQLVKKKQIPHYYQGKKVMTRRSQLDELADILQQKHGVTLQDAYENLLKRGNLY